MVMARMGLRRLDTFTGGLISMGFSFAAALPLLFFIDRSAPHPLGAIACSPWPV
jgi:hypothetical protein